MDEILKAGISTESLKKAIEQLPKWDSPHYKNGDLLKIPSIKLPFKKAGDLVPVSYYHFYFRLSHDERDWLLIKIE